MGPTPLTAPYRLVLQYTVGSLAHRLHVYLNAAPSGDTMGYNTVARPGYGPVGVSAACDNIWLVMQPFYDPTDTSFDSNVIEQRVGGAFVFAGSASPTVAPGGTGSYAPAGGVCFSGKDQSNLNMPFYMYETFFAGFIKASSYAGLSANNKAVANAFFNAGGTATDYMPYAYRCSRAVNVFARRWLALVSDSNQKLRRIRGIA
jgi:hypothetical protein